MQQIQARAPWHSPRSLPTHLLRCAHASYVDWHAGPPRPGGDAQADVPRQRVAAGGQPGREAAGGCGAAANHAPARLKRVQPSGSVSTPSVSTPSGSTPSGSTPSGSTPSGSTPSGSTPSRRSRMQRLLLLLLLLLLVMLLPPPWYSCQEHCAVPTLTRCRRCGSAAPAKSAPARPPPAPGWVLPRCRRRWLVLGRCACAAACPPPARPPPAACWVLPRRRRRCLPPCACACAAAAPMRRRLRVLPHRCRRRQQRREAWTGVRPLPRVLLPLDGLHQPKRAQAPPRQQGEPFALLPPPLEPKAAGPSSAAALTTPVGAAPPEQQLSCACNQRCVGVQQVNAGARGNPTSSRTAAAHRPASRAGSSRLAEPNRLLR